MKTLVICALALVVAFVVGFGGGAGAKPKTPLNCHMVPGSCVTKTTTCPPKQAPVAHQAPHGNVQPPPCKPKTYQSCAPSKKVCDQSL